ncbi:MAG: AGE family epimerase/isomerase [Comamonadaceae bacterium]|nr:AGE family epimerase/isomerase [Comamonadaceae bacterium]
MYFDERFAALATQRSYGHEIEAAWLLTEAAQAVDANDALLAALTRGVAENVLKEALGEDGRVYYGTIHDGKNPTAVWWVQAEAMIGFYDLYRKSGDLGALRATEAVYGFRPNPSCGQASPRRMVLERRPRQQAQPRTRHLRTLEGFLSSRPFARRTDGRDRWRGNGSIPCTTN